MIHYQRTYYYESNSFFLPPVTAGIRKLILINFAIFVCELLIIPLLSFIEFFFTKGGVGFPFLSVIYRQILGFYVPYFMRGAIWQPFTYMFIHSGLSHLFFNMLWLFVFGPEVEMYFSKKRFYTFYIICGAVSVLANFIPYIIRGSQPPVIGASGSIMAILIAFAYINPEREFVLFPLPIPINARGIVILVILINLLYAIGDTQYAVITHFAGMGIGYLYISADYTGLLYKIKKTLGLNKFDVI